MSTRSHPLAYTPHFTFTHWSYEEATRIETVHLPGTMRTLDFFAFSYYTLQTVHVPRTIEYIDDRSWQNHGTVIYE